jgi:hypothetical protein
MVQCPEIDAKHVKGKGGLARVGLIDTYSDLRVQGIRLLSF